MLKSLTNALLLSTALAAPLLNSSAPVEGSYIVVLNKYVDHAKHLGAMRAKNLTVVHEYAMGTFKGYSTKTDAVGLDMLLAHNEVAFVEQDSIMSINQEASCIEQKDSVWGLARTSSPKAGTRNYEYNSAGSGQGVTVYVIDTGVLSTHDEFGGRASSPPDANFINNEVTDDLNGHGTHCAGTIAGKTYGMAKQAKVIGVKVLGRAGSGTNAGVIGGVNYAGQGSGAVLSMSLGGGVSAALDAAVEAAADNGNHVVVASGNDNADGCGNSPARAGGADGKIITVNAMTDNDDRSSFSNYGKCTDLFAPGSAITSAWIGSDTATQTISGTSMACPHVAGMMAKYASSPAGQDAAPDVAKTWLLNSGVQNDMIKNAGPGSPNRLLNAECDEFAPKY